MPHPDRHPFGFRAKRGFWLESGSAQRKAFASPIDRVLDRGMEQPKVNRQALRGGLSVKSDIIADRGIREGILRSLMARDGWPL